MKNLVFALALCLLSTTSFAHDDSNICSSTGECQMINEPVYSSGACYKVKTGFDTQGRPTCTIRYAPVILGYECKKLPGKLFGACELEKQPTCNFDMNTCDDALDPSNLE